MPAYRCSLCGINYPVRQEFSKCPVHRESTGYLIHGEVTQDWEWLATRLIHQSKTAANINADIPIMPVKVREDENGQCWVSSMALHILGLHRRLQPDDVIEIPDGRELKDDDPCDCLWEVQAYRDSTREYWVRPLRVPDTVPEA